MFQWFSIINKKEAPASIYSYIRGEGPLRDPPKKRYMYKMLKHFIPGLAGKYYLPKFCFFFEAITMIKAHKAATPKETYINIFESLLPVSGTTISGS